jgi:hypothetical protein
MTGFRNHPLQPTQRIKLCLELLDQLDQATTANSNWTRRDYFPSILERVREMEEVLVACGAFAGSLLCCDKLTSHADLAAAYAHYEAIAGAGIALFCFAMQERYPCAAIPSLRAIVEAQALSRRPVVHLVQAPKIVASSATEGGNLGHAHNNGFLDGISAESQRRRFGADAATLRQVGDGLLEVAQGTASTANILRIAAASAAILIRATLITTELADQVDQPIQQDAENTAGEATEGWKIIESVLAASAPILDTTVLYAEAFEQLGAPEEIASLLRQLV